jgi:hypothetical protein
MKKKRHPETEEKTSSLSEKMSTRMGKALSTEVTDSLFLRRAVESPLDHWSLPLLLPLLLPSPLPVLCLLHLTTTLNPKAGSPANSVRGITATYPQINSQGEILTRNSPNALYLR